MSDKLYTFVITFNTTDYPDKYCVRRWEIGKGTLAPDNHPIAVTRALESARDHVPPGLFRMNRSPGDDPVIVETWI